MTQLARQDSDEKRVLAADGKNISVLPTPPRRVDLSNYRDIRLELAHVYRLHDQGKLEDGNAKARTYILETMGRLIKSTETDERLAAVERVLKMRRDDENNRGGK